MIDALFDTKNRKSVLGTNDIDENGETTLRDYGVYRFENGELVFDQTVQAEATPGGDAPRGGTGPAEGGSPEQWLRSNPRGRDGPGRSVPLPPRRMPLDGRTAPQ